MPNGVMTLPMKDYGEILGTRGLGERVRARIIELLRSSADRIVLDFQGVRVMTQSFGDEVFRKLSAEVKQDELSRISVHNLSDDVRAVLKYSASRVQPAAS